MTINKSELVTEISIGSRRGLTCLFPLLFGLVLVALWLGLVRPPLPAKAESVDIEGVFVPGESISAGSDNGYQERDNRSGFNAPTLFEPDLFITKVVTPGFAAPGETITYTLIFSNQGDTTATGTVITDIIPTSITIMNIISSGVGITDTFASPPYVWDAGDIPSGNGGIITITGVLTNGLSAGYIFTNTAVITSALDITLTNNTDSISITVLNAPPQVTNFAKGGFEDTDLTFSVADFTDHYSDANGDALASIRIETLPADGDIYMDTIALQANDVVLTADLGNLKFVSDSDWNGSNDFTWVGYDGTAFSTVSATVSLTLTAVNDAPSFTKGEDKIVAEDSGPFNYANWATSISAGPADEQGTQSLAFQVTGNTTPTLFNGGPVVSPSGDLSFTLAQNENGLSQITLVLTDTGGTDSGGVDTSPPQTFTITVTAGNDPPIAVADNGAGFTTTENISFTTASVLANDYDPDGGTPVLDSVDTSGLQGQLTNLTDGTFIYDPDGLFEDLPEGGQEDEIFTYVISDSTGLTGTTTVSLTVMGVNDAPVLAAFGPIMTVINEDATTNPGMQIASIVGGSISDVDSGSERGVAIYALDSGNGTWQYKLDGGAIWQSIAPVSTGSALLLYESDWIRLLPNAENETAAGFSYFAWDRISGTQDSKESVVSRGGDTAFSVISDTASITATSVNDAPVIDNTGDMRLNDINEDETNSNGTLVSNIIASASGDRITDVDTGAVEGIAVIAIDESNGSWEYSTNGVNWSDINISGGKARLLAADANTRVRFVPDGDWSGTVPTGITFRAWDQTSDSNGDRITAPAVYGGTTAFSAATETASIDVIPQSDAPIALPDSGAGFTTTEDAPFTTASVLDNDSEPDGEAISLESVDDTSLAGQLTNLLNGTFIYDPDGQFESLAFNQAASDVFTYTIEDITGLSATTQVTITVIGVNDKPAAVDDSISTGENVPVVVDVLDNDSDIDSNLVPASVQVIQPPQKGDTWVDISNGTIFYTPTLNFTGLVTFTYKVSDDGTPVLSDTAVVRVTVVPASAGGGGFSLIPDALGTVSQNTTSVAWGDIDGDGDLDLAVGNLGQVNQIFENQGSGVFTEISGALAPDAFSTSSLAWGDVDGDGDLDLVVGNSGQVNQLFRNDNGVFTQLPGALGPNMENTHSLALGDYDGDGDLDLAVGNLGQVNRLYGNVGAGIFTEIPGALGPLSDLSYSLVWGDMDLDGDIDLAVGNYGQKNHLYRNDGGGVFSDLLDALGSGSENTTSIAWADVDSDGDIDLAVGNEPYWDGFSFVGGQNQLYENNGGGLFSELPGAFAGLAWTSFLAWGDMDGDSDLDLVVGNASHADQIHLNLGTALMVNPVWASDEVYTTRSVAWGDMDGDGDLDLAVGNDGQVNLIYQNNSEGAFNVVPDALGNRLDYSYDLSWGDYDIDGDLDLVVGNDGINRLYRNEGGTIFDRGNFTDVTTSTLGTIDDQTNSLAWADLDSDGDLDLVVGNNGLNRFYENEGNQNFSDSNLPADADKTMSIAAGDFDSDIFLDLAVGNYGQVNYIYHNDGNFQFVKQNLGLVNDFTYSVIWGDVDNDGDLDLAVGNIGINRLYVNDGGGNFSEMVGALGFETDDTRSLTFGDMDGDGDLDLAVGNYGSNRLYRNNGVGIFSPAGTLGPADDLTTNLVWGEWDGDGDLDLAVGNVDQVNRLYSNNGDGVFTEILSALGTTPQWTYSLGWGDLDGDGDLDLAVSNSPDPVSSGGENQLFLNPRQGPAGLLPDNTLTVDVSQPYTLPAANYYATAVYPDSREIPITYTLFDQQENPVGRVAAYYSLDGGGEWLTAVPATGTQTTNLTASAWPTGTQHLFTWDTFASGLFFGQSDNVVMRFVAYPQPETGGIAGTHFYTDSVSGPFQQATASAITFPFRSNKIRIRVVISDTLGGTQPAEGAMVYRISDETPIGEVLVDGAGNPFYTDAQGYLLGRSMMAPDDQLAALLPITATESYTLYYTNANPTAIGLEAHHLTESEVQTLTVSAAHPLVLFNLDISLEWDARQDSLFVDQLVYDLQRASTLIYDWSDGQVALGEITLYHDQENWNDADVRIYATNRLRPNANQGGITTTVSTDPDNPTIKYAPGQVRMGATWNRYGESSGSLGEDWPRTLAHELGHYLLYLDDNYLGFDAGGLLVPVDSCTGVMGDPYRQDYPYDEFHAPIDWLPECESTLSHQATGRSDWETVVTFYPWLTSTHANTGPASLLLAVTDIEIISPPGVSEALVDPTFYLSQNGSRVQPEASARAFLFNDGDRLIDLGGPTLDHVLARGAKPGNELCVYDLDAERLGCTTVQADSRTLPLTAASNWRPEIIITPVTSTTISVTVKNVASGWTLWARLYPTGASATSSVSLIPSGDEYRGVFNTASPAFTGYVRVWVSTPTTPRRETVVDYALGGNPGPIYIGEAPVRSRFAPGASADGQAMLFGDLEFQEGQFFALQAASMISPTLPWATPVGRAYRLIASPSAPDLRDATISISYLGREVPPGEEVWLRMYYQAPDDSTWQILTTTLDTYHNSVSAPIQGPGVYAIMSSLQLRLDPGWNLFSFPVNTTRPVTQALASIQGDYNLVYAHSPTTPDDPWKLYAPDAPSWVSDLDNLTFGQGYWINITTTQPLTLYLKGAYESYRQAATSFPSPPATLYGDINSSLYFTPTIPMTVTAGVDGIICGKSQVQEVGGEMVYVVSVEADDQTPGCGEPGSPVTFQVENQMFAPFGGSLSIGWVNSQLTESDLRPVAYPSAVDDPATTLEDTPVEVSALTNDSDPDPGEMLTIVGLSIPTYGGVSTNGTTITYTPDLNFNGLDAFSYTIADPYSLTVTGTVNITITPVNDRPVAVDDTPFTEEDTPLEISVLGNDSDVDFDPLTIQSVGQAVSGTVTISGTGMLVYSPTLNVNGSEVFTYTIADPGGLTSTASVTVTIGPINDAPLPLNDSATTAEDTLVLVDVITNDIDLDGSLIPYSVTVQAAPASGLVVVDPTTGMITYSPDLDWYGLDQFSYQVCDDGYPLPSLCSAATVSVTVTPVNDRPIALDDTGFTDEDVLVDISALDNDSDVDLDPLIIQSVGASISGTTAVSGTDMLVYTPALDFNGRDVFTYTIADTSGLTDTAVVTVAVGSIGDAPRLVDDGVTTPEDIPLIVSPLVNDYDPDGDLLHIQALGAPAHGLSAISSPNSLVYTPTLNFNGIDAFTYTVADSFGLTGTAQVTVTVTPVNDAPTIGAIPDQNTRTGISVGPVAFSVDDIDSPIDELKLSANTSDLALMPPNQIAFSGNGLTRTITLTPTSGILGSVSITVTVSDGDKAENEAFKLNLDAHQVFLAAAFQGYAFSPDLVVEQITASSNQVQVVVRNQGNAAVGERFFVDVYLDPDPTPTLVNQTWDILASQGLVWDVGMEALPLMPGQVLTLTAGGEYFRSDISRVVWPIPEGTQIYAQVDSYSARSNYGAIIEYHEVTGGPYNNIDGPVLSTEDPDRESAINRTLTLGNVSPRGANPHLAGLNVDPTRSKGWNSISIE